MLCAINVQSRCIEWPPDFQDSYAAADEILLVEANTLENSDIDFHVNKVRYSVLERFKGVDDHDNYAYNSSETGHHIRMKPGGKYILFLLKEDRVASICRGSREYTPDDPFLHKLRKNSS
ncbi:hypothetical protein GCM10027297_05760 [Parahaliea aestuarii]